MKWILYLAILLAVVVGGLFFVGWMLPVTTTTTRSISLHQPPDAVFTLLVDVKNLAQWNRNTEKVEVLPPVDGKEATKQVFKGGMTMTIITTESAPPHHLVREMGDRSGPFSGSWSYEIKPNDNGCDVVLTEVSSIRNPFYRVMVKIFGPTKYIDEHLEDMAKKFGETATVR